MNPQLIHICGALLFAYSTYHQFWLIKIPKDVPRLETILSFPGRWKYLTIWNLVIFLVYHSYCVLNDAAGSNEVSKKRQSNLQKIRDGLFASWVFPTGIFVSTTFWALFAIDRELVFPKIYDSFYPTWLNHAVHTGPIFFLVLEVLYVPRIFPKRSQALFGTVLLSGSYLTWITWIYTKTGFFPYPILQILNNWQRALFLASLAASLVGLYFLGEAIQKWRWGDVSLQDTKKPVTKSTRANKFDGKIRPKVQ